MRANSPRPFSGDELAKLKEMFEADVPLWVIGDELGRNPSTCNAKARAKGWKRSPRYNQWSVNKWNPSEKKVAWLRDHWNDGTLMAELEAYLGVSDETIYRYTREHNFGRRSVPAIKAAYRERNGFVDRDTVVLRLVKHSGLSAREIGQEIGLNKDAIRGIVERARARGEKITKRMTPSPKLSRKEEKMLRAGLRLGVRMATLAALLTREDRPVTYEVVRGWAKRKHVKMRNSSKHLSIFGMLCPEQLWLHSCRKDKSPVDVVQRAYRIMHVFTVKMALRVLDDYREAMRLFPDIPLVCAKLNIEPKFWIGRYREKKPPHPKIEEWGTSMQSMSTATIAARLTEMFRVIAKTEGNQGPKAYGTLLPAIIRSVADGDCENAVVSLRDTPARLRIPASPEDVDKMYEALDWPLRFLKHREFERRCLLGWAYDRSNGLTGKETFKRFGVSAKEFERARSVALLEISEGLKRGPKGALLYRSGEKKMHTIVFSMWDFAYVYGDHMGRGYDCFVRIQSLPRSGVLALQGIPVKIGDLVHMRNVDNKKLVWSGDADEISFEFEQVVQDRDPRSTRSKENLQRWTMTVPFDDRGDPMPSISCPVCTAESITELNGRIRKFREDQAKKDAQ